MIDTSCSSTRAGPWDGDEPCHDCFTPPGGRHHDNCTVARCALGCRNQWSPSDADQAAFCRHHGAYSATLHSAIPVRPPRRREWRSKGKV
jgi:hypothetical protein